MTQQPPHPIGPVIDGLGCEPILEEGDLVDAAVVVLKVVEPNGDVRLSVCWSEGMSWIERLGMLRAAERVELPRDAESVEE